jgi:hypothetical protein
MFRRFMRLLGFRRKRYPTPVIDNVLFMEDLGRRVLAARGIRK